LEDKLVREAAGKHPIERVIEIGPGPGCLTRSLLEYPETRIVAIEKDTRFKPILDVRH
jgi:16S rRNA A1518/A1519 N6-dimethyltransferase RsmA/KsgA/DIM1 with predicted DNA glycosylase/AP lyase activity